MHAVEATLARCASRTHAVHAVQATLARCTEGAAHPTAVLCCMGLAMGHGTHSAALAKHSMGLMHIAWEAVGGRKKNQKQPDDQPDDQPKDQPNGQPSE